MWAFPAIVVGAALRAVLMSYLPLAYWGSDSRSYFSFTEILLTEGELSLYDKRRYLYPIFLLPVTLLPGSPLAWLAWIQHALGLATLVPLAYLLRKTLVGWRVFIVPLTVLYAGMPILIWYEHELLAETIFFDAVVWMFAGWVAFASQMRVDRARVMWWWFFAAFAVVILTKPAGRFFWAWGRRSCWRQAPDRRRSSASSASRWPAGRGGSTPTPRRAKIPLRSAKNGSSRGPAKALTPSPIS